ncbi:response regulator transcription factor [Lysobacter sp. K5869]|uniref:response regulator n=1 Tax=Lysobacter sp. K5869 TaxID=2820808 RepID=UPI001C061A0B|nr:response regulator transcription factor [Lysobacter sp. K5869]QWP77972.1 response regulator transcription factor [Lysobacter sp. K5869]
METTTLLVADDHAVVREGIRSLLRLAPGFVVVAEADDGEDAVAMARMHVPDVVLLDLMMPGIGGVAAARGIRAASPRSHIMVLTSSDDEALAFAAIEAGAQSFLPKSTRGETLLQAIRHAALGESTLHPSIARRILERMQRARRPAADPFAQLTERELDVLRRLAEGGSNARIAASLAISEKTVKAHLSNLMSKLQVTDRTQAVAFAWREGLMRKKE